MYTIYSKDACQQCDAAKLICSMKGVEFEVKKLDVDFSRDDILSLAPNTRSFPVVFKDGELLGGLEQLKSSLK